MICGNWKVLTLDSYADTHEVLELLIASGIYISLHVFSGAERHFIPSLGLTVLIAL